MISEKYLAGLIDSDGYIGFKEFHVGERPQIQIIIAQKKCHADVLVQLHEDYGGSLRDVTNKIGGDTVYTYWQLYSTAAKKILLRLNKYLVIKRSHCTWCLEQAELKVIDVEDIRSRYKASRQVKYLPLPNYPTRKWLAGYFDGDGCVSTDTKVYKNGNIGIFATIGCHKNDTSGIEIIHKNFGGSITEMTNKTCMKWTLNDRGKLRKFIEYFAKHSHIKRPQLYAILRYLDSEQRTGGLLKEELKQLKQDPQRLNGKAVSNTDVIVQ